MRNILLLMSMISLVSCAKLIPKKQYEEPVRGLDELAIVKTHIGNPFGPDYHATISKISSRAKGSGQKFKSLGSAAFTGHPNEIQILPGAYTLELYCYKSPLYAFAMLDVEVEAGLTYKFKSENLDGKANVKLIENKKASLNRVISSSRFSSP